jgi:hypothetical protein
MVRSNDGYRKQVESSITENQEKGNNMKNEVSFSRYLSGPCSTHLISVNL